MTPVRYDTYRSNKRIRRLKKKPNSVLGSEPNFYIRSKLLTCILLPDIRRGCCEYVKRNLILAIRLLH